MDLDQKAKLEPFAQMYAEMEGKVAALSADELLALRLACDAVSATNCWFATYRVALIIKPMISVYLEHKKASALSGG